MQCQQKFNHWSIYCMYIYYQILFSEKENTFIYINVFWAHHSSFNVVNAKTVLHSMSQSSKLYQEPLSINIKFKCNGVQWMFTDQKKGLLFTYSLSEQLCNIFKLQIIKSSFSLYTGTNQIISLYLSFVQPGLNTSLSGLLYPMKFQGYQAKNSLLEFFKQTSITLR